MKRMICGMLSATLMLASVPARAAGAENTTILTESAVQNHFRQAIDHAVAAVASQPVDAADEGVQPAQARPAAQATQTVSRSGGHVVALVTTLVSSAVGVVGMVYYMKVMKKQMTGQQK